MSFSGCKDDNDEAPSRQVFAFTKPFGNPSDDYWITLHDNLNRELIDAKQVPPDRSTLTFESSKRIANTLTDVTFFGASNNPAGGNAHAGVFPGSWVATAW